MPSLPLASDHAGLPLKLALKAVLEAEGHTITDLGTHGPESVDYPDFAAKVAGLELVVTSTRRPSPSCERPRCRGIDYADWL